MTLETLTWVDPIGAEIVLFARRGMTGRMMPPIRYSSDVIPGQPGDLVRDVQHGARQVVVPILADGLSTAAYRALLRSLAELLDPTRGEGMLRSVDGAGIVRELRCCYIDGAGIEENWPTAAVPSLLFHAGDPYWYDGNDTQVDYTLGTPATFFPFFPLRLSSSEVFADSTVANSGGVKTWPVWEILGPGSSLVVRNLDTGESSSLTRELLAGERVTIDTRPRSQIVSRPKSVTLQDGTNLFPLFAGSLWALQPGSNAVRVEMTGATSASLVTLRYRRRFLSA